MSNLFKRKHKYLILYSYLINGVPKKSNCILELRYSDLNKKKIQDLLIKESYKEAEQLELNIYDSIQIYEIYNIKLLI